MPRLNLPPSTRALLAAILALSALNATQRFRKWSASVDSITTGVTTPTNYLSDPQWAVPYLVLVPLHSLRYPWTFLTAALVENNVVSLSISAVVVWFGGRYLERAWGGKEFAKLVLFVTMLPNVFTFFIYALWHAISSTPDHPTPLQGLLALEAAFLVALKQLVPEHTVSLFRNTLRIRIKHFPALFTLANIVSGPLLGTDTALWLSLFGFLTSWIYLRFFRLSGGEDDTTLPKVQGDASDTFAFVAFFPDAMHPFLAPVTDGIYDLLVQMRLCTPFSTGDVESALASRPEELPGIAGGGEVDGGRRVEAERRRALALKALDQRLSAAAAAGNRTGSGNETGSRIASASDAPDATPAIINREETDIPSGVVIKEPRS